jgi:quercetin dioxygenase-like cupin family protein
VVAGLRLDSTKRSKEEAVTTLDSTRPKVRARPGEPLRFFGMELIWTITPEMSRGTFMQFLHVSPPGTGVPLHIHHGEQEAIYIIDGELVAQVGDETLNAGPGDAVMLPKGVRHGWRVTGDETARILFTFELTPESDHETMFASLVDLPPRRHRSTRRDLRRQQHRDAHATDDAVKPGR